MELRIGQGYDSHRFEEGRPLILCGEVIPWEKVLPVTVMQMLPSTL